LQRVRIRQRVIEGVMTRPFQSPQEARRDDRREHCGERWPRYCRAESTREGEVVRRRLGNLGRGGANGGGGAESSIIISIEFRSRGDVDRYKTAARASLVGHRTQQPSERVGDAEVAPRLLRRRIAHAEDLEGEIDEPRGRGLGVVFEGGEARRRLVFEITLAGIDQ